MMNAAKEISGPLDTARSNLCEIRNLVNAICDKLGCPPPPQTAQGNPIAVAEPMTLIDRVTDTYEQTSSIRTRLAEVSEFISRI